MHIGNIYKHAAAAKAITLEAARAGANGEADALAKDSGGKNRCLRSCNRMWKACHESWWRKSL